MQLFPIRRRAIINSSSKPGPAISDGRWLSYLLIYFFFRISHDLSYLFQTFLNNIIREIESFS